MPLSENSSADALLSEDELIEAQLAHIAEVTGKPVEAGFEADFRSMQPTVREGTYALFTGPLYGDIPQTRMELMPNAVAKLQRQPGIQNLRDLQRILQTPPQAFAKYDAQFIFMPGHGDRMMNRLTEMLAEVGADEKDAGLTLSTMQNHVDSKALHKKLGFLFRCAARDGSPEKLISAGQTGIDALDEGMDLASLQKLELDFMSVLEQYLKDQKTSD